MSQHNIIGSEAFDRSPFVIIRSVKTGGMRRRQTRTVFAFVAGACAAVVGGVVAAIVAFGPGLGG
ncbi:MAG: hypothetical protein Q8S03_11665 [Brevundimonas sp.]|uniref:hypothetical protein n=1 Tax=Brevundimonas sp. TaxID=1871086 RepID=UPI00273614CB|nr:hypothetical protein [Brevundimonas sp.]MBX9615655.1 hypothetical protein [Caulobacteraceae bacterium]MDP3405340.1 hypothetical protein [Brevundimonas sp.]